MEKSLTAGPGVEPLQEITRVSAQGSNWKSNPGFGMEKPQASAEQTGNSLVEPRTAYGNSNGRTMPREAALEVGTLRRRRGYSARIASMGLTRRARIAGTTLPR
ncbi:MAG: hypothetical protein ABR610_05890, partial [Thermoanaerobaculia bacterium]